MKNIKTMLLTLLACFGLVGTSHAVVVLDFDSNATGADIINNPLVTADGTITASATDGSIFLGNGAVVGLSGDHLRFDETTEGGYGQLAFDYDVSSISFMFSGLIDGAFTAQVLDAAFNVVDSFFDSNTNDDRPGGPILLSGSNIRYFRFFDGPGGGALAGVDDLIVTAANNVPEPSGLALLCLGLIGFGLSRRKKA